MNKENPSIILIDTEAALSALAEKIKDKAEFAFDTEFDRFYREYGFKLSLLQIFDSDSCYLVDPVALKDLSPLWKFFEDPAICKVAYSCSEDIQILKVNGCRPKNIYDIQIAAKLCNHGATSLSALMMAEFNVESDKSLQRSNWRRRPLSREQIAYAGNDVTRLLKLKNILEAMAAKRGVTKMIAEDNRACEDIAVTEYAVKLSVMQKRKYSPAHQNNLLDMMLLRNEIAMEYNVPPANIVSDATLESIIENKDGFLKVPFSKGFSKRLAEDDKNQQRFLLLAQNVHGNFTPRVLPERKFSTAGKTKDETANTLFDQKYELLYTDITNAYGKESGEHILRGFKKLMSSDFQRVNKLKEYQQDIIDEACMRLGLKFGQ